MQVSTSTAQHNKSLINSNNLLEHNSIFEKPQISPSTCNLRVPRRTPTSVKNRLTVISFQTPLAWWTRASPTMLTRYQHFVTHLVEQPHSFNFTLNHCSCPRYTVIYHINRTETTCLTDYTPPPLPNSGLRELQFPATCRGNFVTLLIYLTKLTLWLSQLFEPGSPSIQSLSSLPCAVGMLLTAVPCCCWCWLLSPALMKSYFPSSLITSPHSLY